VLLHELRITQRRPEIAVPHGVAHEHDVPSLCKPSGHAPVSQIVLVQLKRQLCAVGGIPECMTEGINSFPRPVLQKGINQSELARRSGVSFQTVNGMVGNRTTRVDFSTLDAISKVLGCEPGDLLEREPRRKR
jgi:DNA-binding Xre family transcriptional regulator